jgi:hypothetical protein
MRVSVARLGHMRRNIVTHSDLTQDKLQELYLEHTDSEIGAMYGISDVAVSYFRRKWGIKTFTATQRAQQGREGLKLSDLTPVKLAELYAQMGDRSIAKLYGVSVTPIKALRRSWGIQAIDKTTRSTSTVELTSEQREVILGTLLGDAHLLDRGVLKVSHSHTQFQYLKRLHEILASIAKPLNYADGISSGSNETFFEFGFRTIQHSWLRSVRDLFYPEGIKVFPSSVLSELTPRSLAFWYFDDGHLDSGLPSFALGDISDSAAHEVARLVGDRFSLDTYLSPTSVPTCKILALRARSADAFFFLIRDFATPDMLYKMPPKHWPQGLVQVAPFKTESEVPIPKVLKDRCRNWISLSEPEQTSLIEDLAVFWRGVGFPHPKPRPEELQILGNLEETQVIQEGVIKARQVGQAVCHSFCPHIWRGLSHGATHSPYDMFEDDSLLRKTLQFELGSGHLPSAGRLRGALRLYRRTGVYNFRPSAAKVLTDRFCRQGGTVFDPCGGYGGRLLGTLLSKAQPKYIACEPSTESFKCLRHMHQWLTSYISSLGPRCEVHCVPAEDFEFPVGVDMVFTSPPYWKREVYCTEETQAGIKYPTYQSWLDNFWRPVLVKSIKALRPGGWLVLCVDDFEIGGQKYDLINDTRKIVSDEGLGSPTVLKYEMPGGGNIEDNHETVLCWCQGVHIVSEPQSGSKPLSFHSCRDCGNVLPLERLRGGVCLSCLEPKGFPKKCLGCGKTFMALRGFQMFHDVNCRARYYRAERRKVDPVKTSRTFTCCVCGQPWETEELGHFSKCPACKEKQEITGRTKTCGYRNCGVSFVDTSTKSSMSYCCPEHRRREKLLRSGKAQDESYFQGKRKGWLTCRQCGQRFQRQENGSIAKCLTCLEGNREKKCLQCGAAFKDGSPKNNRKFCCACQP